MIGKYLAFAAFAIVVSFPGPLGARDSGSGTYDDDLLHRSIKKLEINRPVRIELMNGVRFTGTLIRHLADTLFLTDSLGKHGIPHGSTKLIWRQGRATVTGLIIGSAVGAVGGLIVGGMAARFESTMDDIPGSSPREGGIIIAGTLIGMFTGALIGGGIGALIPKWHRCYKYRPPEPAFDDGRYGP